MRPTVAAALVLLLACAGCDRGSNKSPDELLAEDTTLAMDLARVNDALNEGDPDTLIGLTNDIPAPEAMPDPGDARNTRDADLQIEPPPRTALPVSVAATRTAPEPPPATSGPVRLGPAIAACDSPAAADQRSCLLSLLARYDVGLNTAYRGVIQRMRREAGVSPGAPDPAAVRALRAEQRSWLVYRDQECRRRTQSREGERWAPVRARCLGQLSEVRASLLRDL